MVIHNWISRQRYRRALWSAIQESCDNGPGRMFKNEISPIWGMRAIRDFEKINGVKFDPFNSLHRMTISGKGRSRVFLAYFRDALGVKKR